jgi:hypothetical protein
MAGGLTVTGAGDRRARLASIWPETLGRQLVNGRKESK